MTNAYDDPYLARLYDHLNTWGTDNEFYLSLIRGARAVLDVGCGTGTLLHRARAEGHTGRLVGLDPAAAMLDRARVRTDIEWVHGDLTTVEWTGEFETRNPPPGTGSRGRPTTRCTPVTRTARRSPRSTRPRRRTPRVWCR